MLKNKIHIIFLLIFITQSASYAQIELSQSITETVYLNRTDSFYYANTGINVGVNGKLIINKGVEIRFPADISIAVSGTLEVYGTKDSMVLFTSSGEDIRWGYIYGNNANINLNYLKITRARKFISASYGNISVRNCVVEDTYGGIGDDCIGVHDASTLYINGCDLNGNPDMARIDAMDCDGITDGEISNNQVKNFEDDGVDIGTSTKSILITNNFIYNCNFGVSVGESSVATVTRNVIVNCDGGFQSHSGSNVTAINNTLYGNVKGIECHHGSDASSGGNIVINSTIISQTQGALYTLQSNSSISALFSISDTDTLPGESNLFGDPLFVNAENFNFYLQDTSPCIDAGDTAISINDSNMMHLDIGAFEYIKNLPDTNYTGDTIIDNIEISISPNPASDHIYINNITEQDFSYSIYSSDGKLLSIGKLEKNMRYISIDFNYKGLCILVLKNNNEVKSLKFFTF